MSQKKSKLLKKFCKIRRVDGKGYRRAKRFYAGLSHIEKWQAGEEMVRIVTAKRVWEFLNQYYREHRTTPGLGVIRAELGMLGPTGEKKLARAVRTLEREEYVRISMNGNSKFIVLIRTGDYR